jgi:hypothetical protein
VPRFKNTSGEDRRIGRADGPMVEAGKVTEVDGEVVGGFEETEDAWIVGEGDDARAWPKATWDLLDKPKGKAKSDEKGDN